MAREGLGLCTCIRNYQAIFLYLLAGQCNTALSYDSAEVLEDDQCSLISREGLRWYCKDSEDFDGTEPLFPAPIIHGTYKAAVPKENSEKRF